ncbi:type VI secretion system contractile sheath large subunit [Luteibacter sp. PPL554]
MANESQRAKSAPQGTVDEGTDDFGALLAKAFRPRNERAREEVASAVQTLVAQVVEGGDVVSDDVAETIRACIAEIDRKLSEQVNLILHHPDFQRVEGTWRGLHHLVSQSETGTELKIRVMNLSKAELGRTLKRYKGAAWDQSPIFKKIYEEEYGQLGGEPYGCLIGDYYFDHGPQDVELLRGMAQIAATAHAPFIAAAAPALLGLEHWGELANPRDLAKVFSTPDYAGWRALRDSEDAKYVALTMPRTLARRPYGAKTDPVDGFDFEEDTAAGDASRYTWQNAAFALGANINRSFARYGWCTRIRGVESGGAVDNLPTHAFPTDDGGLDMTCPTEIAITDRRSAELDTLGLMPLVHRKHSGMAAFIGAQSLARPEEYDDPNATANAALSARLPYMFACSRFAHYLKCIVRDKVGSFSTREQLERWLSDWILQYVDGDPVNSSEESKARKPLAEARVVVEAVESSPGYYTSKFFLKPHYQLEGLTVSLRLVARLPSGKGA